MKWFNWLFAEIKEAWIVAIQYTFFPMVVISAAVLLGCSPESRVLIRNPGGSVEVNRDSEGKTTVELSGQNNTDGTSTAPAPAADNGTQMIANKRTKLADLTAQLDALQEACANAVKGRNQADSDASKAKQSLAQLNQDIQKLTVEKQNSEQKWATVKSDQDKVKADVGQEQQAVDALTQEDSKLAATKATLAADIIALSTRRDDASAQLGVIDGKVAERQQQIAALEKKQADNRAAVGSSQASLDRIAKDTSAASVRLNEIQARIGKRQQELEDLERQKDFGAKALSARPATQSAASADVITPPKGMSGTPTIPSSPSAIPWQLILTSTATAGVIAMLLAMFRANRTRDHIVSFDSICEEQPATLSFTLGHGDALSLNHGSMTCEPLDLIDGSFICSDRRGRVKLFPQPDCHITHNGKTAEGALSLAVGDRLDIEVDGQQKSYVFRGCADVIGENDEVPDADDSAAITA